MNTQNDMYELPVTYYTVVQYTPDIFAGETINIGILAYDESAVEVRFLHNWKRVECFVDGNKHIVRNLQSVVKEIEMSCYGTVPLGMKHLTPSEIPLLTKKWEGSVHFSEPRASFRSRIDLLERMSSAMLKDNTRKSKPEVKTRETLRRIVLGAARRAFLNVSSKEELKKVLDTDFRREGENSVHRLDATLVSGHPLFSVHGFSMQSHGWESILELAKFAVIDIFAKDSGEAPVIMAVAPPIRQGDMNIYRDFVRLCRRYKAFCPTDFEAPEVIETLTRERVPASIRSSV